MKLIPAILLIGQLCQAQEVVSNASGDKHLSALSDSTIKREVASFAMIGSSLNLQKEVLTEIPVRNCTDKMVHLSFRSTYIHLYFKGAAPDKSLDSIFLVTHSHYWVKFPKDAFDGLPQANSCDFKAFYSTDRRRLYIYMLGGTASKKYEVTWVIMNGEYGFRIIDEV